MNYQVRSKVALVSLQFLLITNSYSLWPGQCMTTMRCGVYDCRYRYHMAEVPNGPLMVTAGAQLCNFGEKVSIRDNRDGREKRVNGKQTIEHMCQLDI